MPTQMTAHESVRFLFVCRERHTGRSLRWLIGCLDMETAPPVGEAVVMWGKEKAGCIEGGA